MFFKVFHLSALEFAARSVWKQKHHEIEIVDK